MSQPIPLSRLRSPAASRFLTEEQSPRDVEDVFPTTPLFDQPPDPITSPWKRALFDLLESPTSSSSAFLVHFASTSLIVFSAIVTILETVPSFHSISPRVWFGLETSLVLLFTVEYAARAVAWSSSWISLVKWMFCACYFIISDISSHVDHHAAFYGVIDMLAILPYYIEIMMQKDTVSDLLVSYLPN
jgi:potassium voltage-gated channel Shal-related subfamily D protein 2